MYIQYNISNCNQLYDHLYNISELNKQPAYFQPRPFPAPPILSPAHSQPRPFPAPQAAASCTKSAPMPVF